MDKAHDPCDILRSHMTYHGGINWQTWRRSKLQQPPVAKTTPLLSTMSCNLDKTQIPKVFDFEHTINLDDLLKDLSDITYNYM